MNNQCAFAPRYQLSDIDREILRLLATLNDTDRAIFIGIAEKMVNNQKSNSEVKK